MTAVEVRVLGPFEVRLPDGRLAGPWERPVARRVVQFLAVRPSHRIGREVLQDQFFAGLAPVRAANALSKALTMVRRATSPFEVVEADRHSVWLTTQVVVNADVICARLAEALSMAAGDERDRALTLALENGDVLLEDELYVDWARDARDGLDAMRAAARQALARDRSQGFGRTDLAAIGAAWWDVLAHEPASEEACLGLIASEAAEGHRGRAAQAVERTVEALNDLGLDPSPAFVAGVHRILGRSTTAHHPVKAANMADVSASLQAARRARSQLEPRAARSLFAEALRGLQALEKVDRVRLRSAEVDARIQLGELERDDSRAAAADHHFTRALGLARGDAELARAWSALGSVPYRRGDLARAIEVYKLGLEELGGDDPAADVRLSIDLAFALQRTGDGARALEILERVMPALGEVDDPALVGRALDHMGLVLRGAERFEEALEYFQRAFAALGVLEDESALAAVHIHRAGALGLLGRFGEGLADTSAAIRISAAANDSYTMSVARWMASTLRDGHGDLEGALAERDAELVLLRDIGNQRNAAGAEAARAGLLASLGRHDEARRAAQSARQAAAEIGDANLSEAIEDQLRRLDLDAG